VYGPVLVGFGCLGIWGLLMAAYFVFLTDLLTFLAISLALFWGFGPGA